MPSDMPLGNVAVPQMNLPNEQIAAIATIFLLLIFGGMILWRIIDSGVLNRTGVKTEPRRGGELRRGGNFRRGGRGGRGR